MISMLFSTAVKMSLRDILFVRDGSRLAAAAAQ